MVYSRAKGKLLIHEKKPEVENLVAMFLKCKFKWFLLANPSSKKIVYTYIYIFISARGPKGFLQFFLI